MYVLRLSVKNCYINVKKRLRKCGLNPQLFWKLKPAIICHEQKQTFQYGQLVKNS